MFRIYRFYKATSTYLVWHEFSPKHKFTSTAHAEYYLKRLGYSLMEICRDFCFRWDAGVRRPARIEPKSWVLYPELTARKGVKFIGR